MSIGITDHAVLRYMERVHGLDIAAIRAMIRDDMGRGFEAGERLGAGRYAVRTGSAVYVVAGQWVVTVLPAGAGPGACLGPERGG
jgi:hypothetical protein